MNAAPAFAKPATAAALEPAFRIVTRIYGKLLGPEFIVLAEGKYYRVGEITIGQLRRGISPADLDLLECDADGEIE